MNIIDILVIIALGYGLFRGYVNGVIYEVAGLLGLVVGIWAGMRLAFLFADWYRDNTALPENYVPLIAFLTAFILGIALIYAIGRLVNLLVKTVHLNIVNRIAGAVFGAAKWAFLLGTLISFVGNSGLLFEEARAGSVTYPVLNTYCKKVQDYSIGLVPHVRNVFDDVEEYFVELDSVRQRNEEITGDTTEVD